ncbi:MAG: MBL fold metallo-hydrolase [bacterium]
MYTGSVSITILVDNKPGTGLVAEHGLSLWIEADGKCILFDTGQGKALPENARQLGIPLEKTDFMVVSHGHYDHTGGLAAALRVAISASLILHPNAVVPRYSIHPEKPPRPIGMPPAARSAILRVPDGRIIWATQPLTFTGQIGITGPIPRETSFEDVGGPFFLDPKGEQKDCIADDQALWISSEEGLIVCVGCCHAGLVNTLTSIRRLRGNSPIRAVIGGFHLLRADNRRLEQTAEALHSLSPRMLIPCHCTGDQAVQALRNSFGDCVLSGYSGMTCRF